MVVGLTGLFTMAIPAFGRHGHAHAAHGGRAVFARLGGSRLLGARAGGGTRAALMARTAGDAASAASAGRELFPRETLLARLLRWVPSPRATPTARKTVLYGAFGNALVHAGHLPIHSAAAAATVPALVAERFVVRPVWNLLFRFQGQPSSPLGALLLSEAQAVVPFRNGRGVVSVVRDGRVVQLAATLRPDHAALPVKVGDTVRIEDVDAGRERVTVSVVTYPNAS